MTGTVTLLYGGLTGLLVTFLGLNVSRVRVQHRTFIDHAPTSEVLREVRAHGNAAEWAALGIVLLLVLELSGVGTTLLHVFGGALFTGRVLHAAGALTRRRTPLITAGATVTYVLYLAMGGFAVWQHFTR